MLIFLSYKQLGKYDLAWKNIMTFYQSYYQKFSLETFLAATEVVAWLSQSLLHRYLQYELNELKQAPGHDILRAIIWKRLGNEVASERFLASAKDKTASSNK